MNTSSLIAATLLALVQSACTEAGSAEQGQAPTAQPRQAEERLAQEKSPESGDVAAQGTPLGHTGTPALSARDQPLSDTTEIFSMRDTAMQAGPACRIDFAYAGYERESVFWLEPCADVTAKFMDRAQLEQLNRWERIDDYGRDAIAKRTDGQVLYVGGTFAASVYPVDYNHHTIEISVAD